ncbi:hypothetical protein OHA18_26135 [Kribbella sp. NBC_00709]|uniref:hypothetical protein n=1 Tax=Kribbella sp. NBC_00709 TaxID=2975972 RepID=UPI002E297E70|nr:hypothetical protein [Kribbella sp. NBC_00709]
MAAEQELDGFIAKFDEAMRVRIRSCRQWMRARLPDAVELVYDNYNFLVIGFGPTPRPSEAIFSLAAHKRGILLCFLQRAPELNDPANLLRGTGKVVRNVALTDADELNRDEVGLLIDQALTLAKIPMSAAEGPTLVIRSISAKQRPRR